MKKRYTTITNNSEEAKELVHKFYGEGWYHLWSVNQEDGGEVRHFRHKKKEYNVIYKRNKHYVLVPTEVRVMK